MEKDKYERCVGCSRPFWPVSLAAVFLCASFWATAYEQFRIAGIISALPLLLIGAGIILLAAFLIFPPQMQRIAISKLLFILATTLIIAGGMMQYLG